MKNNKNFIYGIAVVTSVSYTHLLVEWEELIASIRENSDINPSDTEAEDVYKRQLSGFVPPQSQLPFSIQPIVMAPNVTTAMP